MGYPPGQFEPTVHAAVIWMYGQLAKAKVENPTIAVLTRSNQVVAEISSLLGKEHSYKTQKLKPVPHEVVWDAELSAAAAVVLAAVCHSVDLRTDEWRMQSGSKAPETS